MKKKLLLLTLLLPAIGAYAQSKAAVADVERIFREFYKTKIVEANLKKQSDIYKNYNIRMNESLTKLRDEFKMLRDSSQNLALSEASRESKRLAAADKYRQMMAKEQEIKDYTRDKLAQLRDERDRERERLLREVRQVIEKHAVLAGYTVVLDKSARSISSFPVVLYSSKEIDITDAVIKELNIGHTSVKNKK